MTDRAVRESGRARRGSRAPVVAGFGIKDAQTAAAMASFADAVVVGSALVSRIEANPGDPARATAEIRGLLAGMRAAMDGAR